MKALIGLALIASLFLPGIASADKNAKGPKEVWKQQEKWDKELRKREDKYWKAVEKDRKEYWKRQPYLDPGYPPYPPRTDMGGNFGPYRFEVWRD